MKPNYQLNTGENRSFLAELRQNLLNFGRRFPSPGGSSYYLGDDGTPWPDRGRETWITSRMAHVYSIGTLLGDAQAAPWPTPPSRACVGSSTTGHTAAGTPASTPTAPSCPPSSATPTPL